MRTKSELIKSHLISFRLSLSFSLSQPLSLSFSIPLSVQLLIGTAQATLLPSSSIYLHNVKVTLHRPQIVNVTVCLSLQMRERGEGSWQGMDERERRSQFLTLPLPPFPHFSYYLPKLEQSSRVKHSTTSTTLTHTHSEREHSAYHLAQLHIVYIETKLVLSAEKSKICPQISTQLSYDSITE